MTDSPVGQSEPSPVARSMQGLGPSEYGITLMEDEADALLAAMEWALNHPDLDLGPGLRLATAERAARKVERARFRDREFENGAARIVGVMFERKQL